MDRADVLIIMDGSLAGAVACAMECERGHTIVAWLPPPRSGLRAPDLGAVDAARAERLVREQAELHAVGELIISAPDGARADPSMLLLDAARAAGARAAARVVWPVARGDSVDAMYRVTERADLATRLARLDAEDRAESGPGVRIETPFVDLTHDQLLDLARDLEICEETWVGRQGIRR